MDEKQKQNGKSNQEAIKILQNNVFKAKIAFYVCASVLVISLLFLSGIPWGWKGRGWTSMGWTKILTFIIMCITLFPLTLFTYFGWEGLKVALVVASKLKKKI